MVLSPLMPIRSFLGKYVPAKKGVLSGVMKMVKGQPPCPVKAWQTVIYMLSISGRSSLSTLIEIKLLLRMLAISSSSKDSLSITWHQWQVE
jgi:hypothetical protein